MGSLGRVTLLIVKHWLGYNVKHWQGYNVKHYQGYNAKQSGQVFILSLHVSDIDQLIDESRHARPLMAKKLCYNRFKKISSIAYSVQKSILFDW